MVRLEGEVPAEGVDVTLKNRKGKTCVQKATRKPVDRAARRFGDDLATERERADVGFDHADVPGPRVHSPYFPGHFAS